MSDEEKQAIKSCNLLLNGDITLHIIDDDGGTAYAGAVNKLYNKDLETVLYLIEKQQKVIDEMAKYINKLDIDEDICMKNVANTELCNEEYSNCVECIKEYFKKKVDEN